MSKKKSELDTKEEVKTNAIEELTIKDQLEILLKDDIVGVRNWNNWREEKKYPFVNLSGVNLSGVDLSGINFSSANLEGINLKNANLYHAKFKNANLKNANLSGSNLFSAQFSGANLEGANLENTFLYGANLFNCNLSGANLNQINLPNGNMMSYDFSGAILTNAILYGCNLSAAWLVGADLTDADLRKTNLTGTVLQNANLSKVKLDGATFGGTVLTGAKLSEVNLNEVDLSDIRLSDSKIELLDSQNYIDEGGLIEDANFLRDWDTLVFDAPQDWYELSEEIKGRSKLTAQICEINYTDNNPHNRFIKVSLTQRVIDHNKSLKYLLWAVVSEENFQECVNLYNENTDEKKHFEGAIANNIDEYDDILWFPVDIEFEKNESIPKIIPWGIYDLTLTRNFYLGVYNNDIAKGQKL